MGGLRDIRVQEYGLPPPPAPPNRFCSAAAAAALFLYVKSNLSWGKLISGTSMVGPRSPRPRSNPGYSAGPAPAVAHRSMQLMLPQGAPGHATGKCYVRLALAAALHFTAYRRATFTEGNGIFEFEGFSITHTHTFWRILRRICAQI